MGAGKAALEAKVHGLYGKLRFSESAKYLLKGGALDFRSRVLQEEGIPASKIKSESLADFEMAIKEKGEERCQSLRHFMNKKEKDFFDSYRMEDELQALRIYLGLLLQTDRTDLISFVDLSPYREILKFSTDRNIEAAKYLRSLEDRPYFRIIEPYTLLKDDELTKREFYLSVNLEKWHFQNLIRQLKAMPGEKDLKKFISEEIDWANIQWIYRARRYRQLDLLTVTTLTIEGGREFNRERLKEACQLSPDEVLQKFLKSRYGDSVLGKDPVGFLDIGRQRYMARRAKKLIYGRSGPLAKAVAFLVLSEAKVSDLCRMAEARSLNLADKDLVNYLINIDEKLRIEGRENGR